MAHIIKSINHKVARDEVNVADLRSYIVNLGFFERDLMEKLSKAESVNNIIDVLTINYCSFLNCEILQDIVEYCNLDKEQKELKYREHLVTFIDKHTLSQFNPLLGDFTDPSKKLIIKFDIDWTASYCKIAKIFDFKRKIATIMGLDVAALRLINIKEGCVECTFLIATRIAEFVLAPDKISASQEREFQALPILKLQCDDNVLYIKDDNKDFQGGIQIQPKGMGSDFN